MFLQFSCQQEGYESQEEVEKGLLPRRKVIEVKVEVADFFNYEIEGGESGVGCYHDQRVGVLGVDGVRGTGRTSVLI